MKIIKHSLITFLIFFIISCKTDKVVAPFQAEIYYAAPSENIIIDGNSEDWADIDNSYEIKHPVWQSSDSITEDYKGHFKVAYNSASNQLLVLVQTNDSHNVQNPENLELGDLYAMFIDTKHHPEGSGVMRYKFSQHQKSMTREEQLWDDSLKDQLNWDVIEYQVSAEDGITTYEIAITLRDELYAGRVLGLGHLLQDVDNDNETVYAWIDRGDKDYNAQLGRLGQVMILEGNESFGSLSSNLLWEDQDSLFIPEQIKVFNENNDWFYLNVNDKKVDAFLPDGTYSARSAKTLFFQDGKIRKIDDSHSINFAINSEETYTDDFVLKEKKYRPSEVTELDIKKLDQETITRLEKEVSKVMDFYEVEGAALSLIENDSIIYSRNFGFSNSYSKSPIDESTLFEVASITKTVFAYLVLRLVDKGLINLDTPMYKDLEFEAIKHDEYSKLITPRMVLSHKTGLPNWGGGGQIDFKFKPGTDFSYSGEAYEYLKRYVEKITGKSAKQLFDEEVVLPLNLKDFYFEYNPIALEKKSFGHYEGHPGIKDLFDTTWAAASLITNTKNLSKFLISLSQGKGLKTSTFQEMISFQNKVPSDFIDNYHNYEEYMGLGVFVESKPGGVILRHSGNNGDFKSLYKYDLKRKVGYVLLTNSNKGDFLIDKINKALY